MAHPLPFRLTLASGSRGRRYLMERAGYSFAVLPADIDEPTEAPAGDIRRYVHETAWRKAAAVAPRVADGVVIAADTVGWIDGKVIGKPADAADACRILETLMGRDHELWTGVALWRRPDGVQLCWQEVSRLHMKRMGEAELAAYLAGDRWHGASGAYSINEDGDDPLLTVREGTVSNVIGLPMETLARLLPAFGAGG